MSQISDKQLMIQGESRHQHLMATQKQVTPGYTLLILKEETNELNQGSVSERNQALQQSDKNVDNLTFMNTGP